MVKMSQYEISVAFYLFLFIFLILSRLNIQDLFVRYTIIQDITRSESQVRSMDSAVICNTREYT